MSIYGVICAGGIGSRMNGEKPKQFLQLAGKPMIIYSVEKLLKSNVCDEILVLVPSEWIKFSEEIIKQNIQRCSSENNKVKVIAGGNDRNQTIDRAIEYVMLGGKLDRETIFVTHDAARPFLTEKMIRDSIEELKNADATTVAIPVTNTVLISENGETVNDVPDRTKVFDVQTPQTFRALEWKEKYEKLSDIERRKLTDITGLYVKNNCKVAMVLGTDSNIKITYPKDVLIAEEMLALLT